ncbi:hypothetical protein GCM10027429_28150 [Marivirga atlantica]|jgi:predicted membrane protein|uniref:Uncharacterized protein n=1 Tax=Marivirga atlantica TaxID=1548457 RepID=A0A937A9Q0_9BACT|nr:hypothetical protein [Marivirga atlantica]MBL0766417.1 hypothetical protein [Marivirga atlantica]
MKAKNKKALYRGLVLVIGILVAVYMFLSGFQINNRISEKHIGEEKLLYTPLVYKLLINS